VANPAPGWLRPKVIWRSGNRWLHVPSQTHGKGEWKKQLGCSDLLGFGLTQLTLQALARFIDPHAGVGVGMRATQIRGRSAHQSSCTFFTRAPPICDRASRMFVCNRAIVSMINGNAVRMMRIEGNSHAQTQYRSGRHDDVRIYYGLLVSGCRNRKTLRGHISSTRADWAIGGRLLTTLLNYARNPDRGNADHS